MRERLPRWAPDPGKANRCSPQTRIDHPQVDQFGTGRSTPPPVEYQRNPAVSLLPQTASRTSA
jgi:hypothetical protein